MFICLILSISHPIMLRIKDTLAGNFVRQMSVHLTVIFVIQWILIGIAFSVCRAFDLPDIPLGWVIPVGILTALATGILLQLFLKRKSRAVPV